MWSKHYFLWQTIILYITHVHCQKESFDCKESSILTFWTFLCKWNFKIALLMQVICLLMILSYFKKHIILSITLHISSLPEPLPQANTTKRTSLILWHSPATKYSPLQEIKAWEQGECKPWSLKWHARENHLQEPQNLIPSPNLWGSVATAIADVFWKNAISMGRKFMKMLKIFDKIDEMENWRLLNDLRLFIPSILSNIYSIFENFPPTLIAFFQKTLAIAMATLLGTNAMAI